ncbi:hypothetical protein AKO1_002945, partial [Acrasis kona]
MPTKMLPWVNAPRDLLGRELMVEVFGTHPRRTKVAHSIVKFDREDDDEGETPQSPEPKKPPTRLHSLAALKPIITSKIGLQGLNEPQRNINNTHDSSEIDNTSAFDKRKLKVLKVDLPDPPLKEEDERNKNDIGAYKLQASSSTNNTPRILDIKALPLEKINVNIKTPTILSPRSKRTPRKSPRESVVEHQVHITEDDGMAAIMSKKEELKRLRMAIKS